jgi:DNA ligase-1
VLLRELAEASGRIGATAARSEKTALLADVLRGLGPGEVLAGVAFLSGELPQRQIGAGPAVLRDLPAPAAEAELTVGDVDATFDAVAGVRGAGAQAARRELLADLLARATAAEQQFLVRLLLGGLRQGALAGVMADAVARAAGVPLTAVRRALMLRGDLGAVAEAALTDGATGLAAFRLAVGTPLQPMLAGTAADVAAALEKTGPAAVEHKLDGARIQVHRDGADVSVFTRSLDDVTARVPELVEAALALPASAVVLDGEAIALREDGRPHPFQVTASRFGSHATAGGLRLTPALFDVLHLDGEDLLDRPGAERSAALAALVPEGQRITRAVVEDAAAGDAVLRDALAHGHEGVVVKALDAPYAAGRRGAGWLKVKVATTLDLVVLAAEWGHGRRTGTLSNLHLGARNDGPDGAGEFVMLGKTFKGLTDAMLAWQTERLLDLAVERPRWGVRVRPELVVEIALDGVQTSTRYPGGVALRFARVKGYREDKARRRGGHARRGARAAPLAGPLRAAARHRRGHAVVRQLAARRRRLAAPAERADRLVEPGLEPAQVGAARERERQEPVDLDEAPPVGPPARVLPRARRIGQQRGELGGGGRRGHLGPLSTAPPGALPTVPATPPPAPGGSGPPPRRRLVRGEPDERAEGGELVGERPAAGVGRTAPAQDLVHAPPGPGHQGARADGQRTGGRGHGERRGAVRRDHADHPSVASEPPFPVLRRGRLRRPALERRRPGRRDLGARARRTMVGRIARRAASAPRHLQQGRARQQRRGHEQRRDPPAQTRVAFAPRLGTGDGRRRRRRHRVGSGDGRRRLRRHRVGSGDGRRRLRRHRVPRGRPIAFGRRRGPPARRALVPGRPPLAPGRAQPGQGPPSDDAVRPQALAALQAPGRGLGPRTEPPVHPTRAQPQVAEPSLHLAHPLGAALLDVARPPADLAGGPQPTLVRLRFTRAGEERRTRSDEGRRHEHRHPEHPDPAPHRTAPSQDVGPDPRAVRGQLREPEGSAVGGPPSAGLGGPRGGP